MNTTNKIKELLGEEVGSVVLDVVKDLGELEIQTTDNKPLIKKTIGKLEKVSCVFSIYGDLDLTGDVNVFLVISRSEGSSYLGQQYQLLIQSAGGGLS